MVSSNCDRCGAVNFKNQANLTNHQKSIHCKTLAKKKSTASHIQLQGLVEDAREHPNFLEGECSVPEAHANTNVLQEERPYDSTFSLVNWIRHCKNGMGLSERDITNLFRNVLFHKSFKLEDVTVKSVSDCNNYEDALHRYEDGWLEYKVKEEIGDPYPVCLYYKDPAIALSTLFSAPANGENFDLGPLSAMASSNIAEPSYSIPSTCNWWKFMQGHIACEGAVIAPLIFYSDQTSLSNNGRVSGYPLVLSLGNIACELRAQAEGHILLGVMPVIPASDISSHQRRLEIFHECLHQILKPLKKLSFRYVSE
jgi:hypothetical protein